MTDRMTTLAHLTPEQEHADAPGNAEGKVVRLCEVIGRAEVESIRPCAEAADFSYVKAGKPCCDSSD